MEFEITFYEDENGKKPVEEFLLKLVTANNVLFRKASADIEKLRYKFYHKIPLSKHLETGLWELRVKAGTDILRIIYTFQKGQVIILLHGFIKKQQKTPNKELEIARKRLKEIKLKGVN